MKLGLLLVALLVPATLSAQSLAEVAKKAEEERGTKPTINSSKVYTNKDLGPSGAAQPDKFEPTPDNVFVCKARSMKALFAAVDKEHNGFFTERFANLKLRDDPALREAATADRDNCEKGRYVGAMAAALKAQAEEAERLQELLKTRIPK